MNATILEAQNRIITRWGNQISIRLDPTAYGYDVSATLYRGGIENAKVQDTIILTWHNYRPEQTHDAQNHYDQAVIILGDA